jgi:hypothetical protein
MSYSVNKNLVDVSKIYQAYITFAGDIEKTALACEVDKQVVRDLANAERWNLKVKDWLDAQKEDPRGSQIQINRAINYVQAHRLRGILDSVVQFLQEGTPEDLINRLTVVTKNGPEFKTRALTDLVKAAETVQLMTARALGDTEGERPATQEQKGSNIALQVMAAMNSAEEVGLNSVDVVKKSLAEPPRGLPLP